MENGGHKSGALTVNWWARERRLAWKRGVMTAAHPHTPFQCECPPLLGRGGCLLLVRKYWCYAVDETSCVFIVVISFPSKSHKPRIFWENLKISIFLAKICKIQLFQTLTSLKHHRDVMKGYWTGTFRYQWNEEARTYPLV